MSELWLDLLPIAAAMAITPGRLMALILLFHAKQAAFTSLSYVGGMVTNMLIVGLAFALIFSLTGVFNVEDGAGPPAILAILFVVIGILMIVGATKMIFQKEDEDKAPPDWLSEIEAFTPAKAY